MFRKKLTCRFKVMTKGKGEYDGYTSVFKTKTFMFDIPVNDLGFRLFDELSDNVYQYIKSLYPNDIITISWIKG